MGYKNKYFILIYSYGICVLGKVVTVGEVIIGCRKLGCEMTFDAKTLSCAIIFLNDPRLFRECPGYLADARDYLYFENVF